MPPKLSTESVTVQYPLLRYAGDIGWEIVPQSEALSLRKGEGGMLNYSRSGVMKRTPLSETYPFGYKTLPCTSLLYPLRCN
jgi:hypothetical protein